MSQQLLDTKQVAELLNISMPNLYKMLANGKIPTIKVGGSYRFDREEVIEYFRNETQSRSKKMKKSYYAVIPANVRYDKNLTPNAKLLYGEITALCNEKGYCWANNRYFAELYEVSITSISQWIKQLVTNGYLTSSIIYAEDGKTIKSRYLYLADATPAQENLNTPTQENLKTPIKKLKDPAQENLNTPTQENLKDNNTSINTTKNNKYNNHHEIERLESNFNAFWDLYPKKVAKQKAKDIWLKNKYNDLLTEKIIDAITQQVAVAWKNTEKQYIPNPTTWLNQKRWEDEIIKAPPLQNNRRTPAQSERERIKDPSEYDHPTNANAYARAWFEKQEALAAQGAKTMHEFFESLMATEAKTCPVCGEQLYRDISITDDNTGEEVILRMKALCTCEYEKKQEADRTIRKLERQSRIDYLKRRHLPEKRLHGFTFEKDDSPKSEASIICKRYVDRWQTVKEKGYGLLLHGNVGTGKTFYAACIVNAMIEKGVAAELTTITRLINTIAIENRDVALTELNRLPLIVIDDLGAERQTEYSREMAFTVIDERIKSKRPLIVTTNLSPDEMVQADDMSQLRTYERVLEACPIRVGLTGRSRRRSDDKQKVETAMKDLFS